MINIDNRKKNYGALIIVKVGLIVIIVLIIRLIVINYNKSQYRSYRNTVYTMIDACEIYQKRMFLQGKSSSEIEFICTSSGCYHDEDKLDYIGDIPDTGTLTISKDGLINGTVAFKKAKYTYTISNSQIN